VNEPERRRVADTGAVNVPESRRLEEKT